MLPGHHDLGGLGGDRQPAAHPGGLVVVVDQVVLSVDDFQAVDVQADDFPWAAAGVAQELIDGAVLTIKIFKLTAAKNTKRRIWARKLGFMASKH